ncbi:hypothetical protein ABIC83_002472 [Roseateles asaccharophilus]|uniref:hypothetical protein n=1 Tax=Roseateles asaccharophilus TaxID=582607 RepID=UPI0038385FA7
MSKTPIDTSPAGLVALGFVAVRYDGQDGTFYRRDTKVETMPYMKTVVDDQVVFADSVAVTEISPEGGISMNIPDTDYLETFKLESEDGLALLKDSAGGIAEEKLLELGQVLV